MRKKYKGPCYYCGRDAFSMEHVPPRQMFKAFECDSITVPACDKHNTEKSGDDQAIVSAFVRPLYNGKDQYSFEADVIKAIEEAKSSFKYTKRKAIDSPLLDKPPEDLQDLPNLAYLVPDVDIANWVRQLTAALVYDGIDNFDSTIQWEEGKVWCPDWIPAKGPASVSLESAAYQLITRKAIQSELEQLVWIDGWSAEPRPYPRTIYGFQIHFESDAITFRHKFYNSYYWYMKVSTSRPTLMMLMEKAITASL